ncbi:hypothetical protein H9X84_02735 [Anaerotignum lactatifermentans]|nr:hypothetical protein [Anaerotignum lactatifermentans]
MTLSIFHVSSSQTYTSVDTMMRTTAATIFGYFISISFEKDEDPVKLEKENAEIRTASAEGAPSAGSEMCRLGCRIHQQIVIVAGIGVLSLGILLLLRNFAVPLPQGPTPVTLMQDFIVGSVGFLIGHAKYEKT